MSTLHLDHIIQSAGLELVRDRKHRVYHHTKLNKILVTASTPSNHRAEANVIAQVAKLTGRKKRDLLRGSNKRKPKPATASSVVSAPPPPAQTIEAAVAAPPPKPIVEETIPGPAPLTARERKYLRRLEKHEAQHKKKKARHQKQFEYWVAAVHAHLRLVDGHRLTLDKDKIADEYEAAAVALYLIARRAGHYEAELMVADCMKDGRNTILFIIRVGRHYLDLLSASVHDSPRWTIDLSGSVAQVEVWGSLKVDEEGDGYVIRDSEV